MNEQYDAFSHESTSISVSKIKSGPPLSWIVDSFKLIKKHWKTVIPAYFVMSVLSVFMKTFATYLQSGSAGVGTVVFIVLGFLLCALLPSGMIAVFHGAAEGNPRVKDLFRGFKRRCILKLFILLVIGVLACSAFSLVMFLLGQIFDGGAHMLGVMVADGLYHDYSSHRVIAGAYFLVIFFLMGALVILALFGYAVPQVVVSDEGVISSLKNSFVAIFGNLFLLVICAINAAAIFVIVMFFIMAGVPFSAAWILIVPLMFIALPGFSLVLIGAYYLSFREILLARSDGVGVKAENA